jgi:hypothetical protein
MNSRGVIAAGTVLMICGALACVPPSAANEAALAPARAVGPIVECDSGCKPEWERAQVWIAKHSNMKIQTATDLMIQTYTSVDYSTYLDFTVVKEPVGAGRYRITARTHCAAMFGCSPSEDDTRSTLLYYIKTGTDLYSSL